VKTDILLTGLVSGLTILLGVITADWLKRLRDRINYTRRITTDISHSVRKYIEYLGSQLSPRIEIGISFSRSQDENELIENFNFLLRELRDLSEIPRWPQRNARRIRQAAFDFRICVFANFEHCRIHQVLLHEENADELRRLELALRIATRSRRAFETMTRDISEKTEELKEQMLSREAANS
jgi:hypothetical protein